MRSLLRRGVRAGVRVVTIFRRPPRVSVPSMERPRWQEPLNDAFLRRLERLAVGARDPARGGLGGEHRSRARAASPDFADYRRYQPGDDFRRVDWNAYGRLDQLYVKLTEARERLTLQLLIDCSASMGAGEPNKLDFACQVAASLGFVTLRRYDRVLVRALWGPRVASRLFIGRTAYADLLVFLDGLRPSGVSDFATGLEDLRAERPGRIVLISDLLDPRGPEAALAALTALRSETTVVQVLSPQESRPDYTGDVELQDLETEETVEVGLTSQAVATYRQRLDEWCDRWRSACLSRGVAYARLSSGEPLEFVVLGRLREAGAVR
ncbi:MAG: DUF58 domain-containing protein [Chloroflexi bacterium]|nr:DUF58 domain-containing protein [Chloroflexota bacterium]